MSSIRHMTDSRSNRDPHTNSMISWVDQPEFEFADEVDALMTLHELGDELRAAREQVRHTMRYMQAAIVQARSQHDVSPQALIGESGLARQTVYTMLGTRETD